MNRLRATGQLIHPDAHPILLSSHENGPNGDDPWQLEFANGPADSLEPEHQAVIVAYSDGGDEEATYYLRWVADMLAGAIQRNLVLPEEGEYIAPDGTRMMMTYDMIQRYGWFHDRDPLWTGTTRDAELDIDTYGEDPYDPRDDLS